MTTEIPAGFVMFSRAEAATAMAACRIAVERHRSPAFRDLADDLARVLRSAHEPMSAGGHVSSTAADMGSCSGGMNGGEVVSIEVVAAALHCSDRHARRLCPPDGPLRGRKVGRDWMIDRDSLDELVAERSAS